jgi:hypothetical protein
MIILHGEDAEQFRRSVFNPTKEELNEQAQRIKELDSSIKIKETENGYTATISNLDLSFLDTL